MVRRLVWARIVTIRDHLEVFDVLSLSCSFRGRGSSLEMPQQGAEVDPNTARAKAVACGLDVP